MMRQPYATLFAGFEEHWMLGPYLTGPVPNWEAIEADPSYGSLSSGELVLLGIGRAIWNGDRTTTIADLAVLDHSNRLRALAALAATL